MDKEQRELAILIGLVESGWRYLARDSERDTLFLFEKEPINAWSHRPEGAYWIPGENYDYDIFKEASLIDDADQLFPEVVRTSREPTSIKDLLLKKTAKLSDSITLKEFIERVIKQKEAV